MNSQIQRYPPSIALDYILYMKFNLSILAFLAVAAAALAAPKELVKFSISSYILPDKQLSMELDFAVPRTPNYYPVILYLTGLSGALPSYFQSNLIDSIAQQGYVWLTISKLQSPNPDKITQSLAKVMDWLNENLQVILNSRAPGVIAELQDKFILIGHSAAGHVTTQYLNSTCGNVKLQILLDPVDGSDPFGFKKDYIITPGKFLPYATPVLVLATELDHHSNLKYDPPCAPLNLSNLRFYDAMSGPKWFLNVSKYGHADFFNNQYRDIASVACATCRKDCNFGQYRTEVKEVILSFMDAILEKDALALSYIEQAKFSIPTAFKHDYNGFSPLQGGFCQRAGTSLREEVDQ